MANRTRSRALSLLLLLTLALAGPPPTRAATTHTVTCNGGAGAQLTTFVATAAPGDVILIPACVVPVNLLIVAAHAPLTLIGAGAAQTILDGGGLGEVVVVSVGAIVTLGGVTIRNGHANGHAGGVVAVGTLLLTDRAITGNTGGEARPLGWAAGYSFKRAR